MKPKNDALEPSVSNTCNINAEIILNRAPVGLRLKTLHRRFEKGAISSLFWPCQRILKGGMKSLFGHRAINAVTRRITGKIALAICLSTFDH